jgi:hypothetical protein
LLFPDKELMIQIAPQMRIMLAVAPADFRKGIDGLAAVCRKILKQDPFSGYIFVFRNKLDGLVKSRQGVMPATAGIRAPGSRRDPGGESPPPGDARSR